MGRLHKTEERGKREDCKVKALRELLAGQSENYIAPFFWMHGEGHDALLRELCAVHASGIRCICVESRPHPDFCGPGWWEDMAFLLDACAERGMKLWLLDDKHFPTGYCAGLLENRDPALRRWEITERHADIIGPVDDGALMAAGWLGGEEDSILSVLACRRDADGNLTGETIDITGGLRGDMVYFSVPAGDWRVVFLLKTRSLMKGRKVLYCDPLSSDSMDVLLETVYESHYRHFAAYFGNTFEAFFSDEPCFSNANGSFEREMGVPMGVLPWHDALPGLLLERLGRDPLPLLPGLWLNLPARQTAEIRIAFMDVITGLYSRNLSEKLGTWCRAHGVLYTGHVVEDNGLHTQTGAAAGHFFRSMQGQDISGIDVVYHQLLPGMAAQSNATPACYRHTDNQFFHYCLGKLGASLAHLTPGMRGRAMCEIFGAYGWAEDLKLMKWLADHMLVRGINIFVPHAFSPKYPDPDCPPHFYAGGHNPQFPYFRLLMAYMNRMSHLLSGAAHRACAVIAYDAEAVWSGGGRVRMEAVAKALYDRHIDYDIADAAMLAAARVENGRLCIASERFDVLILPGARCMDAKRLLRAYQLAQAGVPVVFAGMRPDVFAFAEDADAPAAIAPGIPCVAVDALAGYIANIAPADVQMDTPEPYLRVYHCEKEGAHLYALFNESTDHTVDTPAAFAAGGAPLVYDAMDNTLRAASMADGKLRIRLAPYQGCVLIFGANMDVPAVPDRVRRSAHPVTGPWTVDFAVASDTPVEEKAYEGVMTMNTLRPLHHVAGRADFSGHARYRCRFTPPPAPAGSHFLLALERFGDVADVWVNGQHAGVRIAPPYRFDIGRLLRAGENDLTVIVSNHLGWQMKDSISKYLLFEAAGLRDCTLEVWA